MIAPKLVDGDFVIENGNWVFVEGEEEMAQSVKSTLTMRKGEFFLEEEAGMVYDNFLGKHTVEAEARDDIIEAASKEERVAAVRELEIVDDERKRTRSVSLVVEFETGELVPVDAGTITEGVN